MSKSDESLHGLAAKQIQLMSKALLINRPDQNTSQRQASHKKPDYAHPETSSSSANLFWNYLKITKEIIPPFFNLYTILHTTAPVFVLQDVGVVSAVQL